MKPQQSYALKTKHDHSLSCNSANRFHLQGLIRTTLLVIICIVSLSCSEEEQDLSIEPDNSIVNTNTVNQAMPSNAVVLREYQLTDPGMNNIVANTVLIPEGWTTEGGLQRLSNQLYSMAVIADFKVIAADGRQVRFYPSLIFEFNYDQPGQLMQPTLEGNIYLPLPDSPSRWVMNMAQINPDPSISNLRLIAEQNLPDLTAQLRQSRIATFQQLKQMNQSQAWLGLRSAADIQATKVVIEYEQAGRKLEETMLIQWEYNILLRNETPVSGIWSINLMRSMRGPVGSDYLNDPVLAAILNSVRTNPQWQSEMNRYFAKIAQIRHKGHMDRQRIAAQGARKLAQINSEISDIISNGYSQQSASSERMAEQFTDMIREETVYTVAGGETVKLPSFYDHVYTDGNGRYLLYNDALYNPNIDPAINQHNWQRIEANP